MFVRNTCVIRKLYGIHQKRHYAGVIFSGYTCVPYTSAVAVGSKVCGFKTNFWFEAVRTAAWVPSVIDFESSYLE